MVTEELLQFVRAQRAAGMKDDEIEHLLIAEGGWDKSDVEELYRALKSPGSPTPSSAEKVGEPRTSVGGVTASPQPAATVTTPVVSNGKKENWSLDQLLAKTNSPAPAGIPVGGQAGSPASFQANNRPPETAPVSPTSPAPSPKGTLAPVPAASLSMKFDLSMLGSSVGTNPPHTSPAITPASSPQPTPPSTLSSAPAPHPAAAKSGAPIAPASAPAPASLPTAQLPHTALSKEEVRQNIHLEDKSAKGAVGESLAGIARPVKEVAPAPLPPITEVGGATKPEINEKRTMSSDLLLRGKGSAVSSMPAISVPPEQALPEAVKEASKEQKEQTVTTSGFSQVMLPSTPLPFQSGGEPQSAWKRILEVVLGVVLLIALLGGGFIFYYQFRAPNPQALLSAAFAQFFDVSFFTYKGQTTTDLALSAVDGDTPWFGSIKFSLVSEGSLGSGIGGYGDGIHKISFTGGWQVGTSTLATSIDADIRLIEDALYFHVLSFPDKGSFDFSLFKENWVKMDFSDIFNELQISGVLPGGVYGNFGAPAGAGTFNTLLKKAIPLVASENPTTETIGGVATTRIHVSADPVLMANFVRALYQKYFNEELTLSEDQSVRLNSALARLTGDVWIDSQKGSLVQIALSANFDDDVVGTHVKGPVAVRFSFSDYNKTVSVDVPEGSLTLSELKAKTSDYQKTKEMRVRDQAKIDHVNLIAQALESYRQSHDRYPKELTELSGMNMLTTSSINLTSKDYFYRSYQKPSIALATTSTQCRVSGKECDFYHLGVNLEDISNNALKTDADVTTTILGADTAGCGGEANLACYDLVSPPSSTSSTGTLPPTLSI